MDKSDFILVARDVFTRYPHEPKVFITSDGQAFIDEVHARNHAARDRDGHLLIYSFLRVECMAGQSASGDRAPEVTGQSAATAKDLIAQLKELDDRDAINDILTREVAGPNRSTVITAGHKRLQELQAERATDAESTAGQPAAAPEGADDTAETTKTE